MSEMNIIRFAIAVLLAISVLSCWLIAETRKRRFQFTIRHLLIATALLASVLGVARWVYLAKPWMTPRNHMAIVALCERATKSMLLEYRMDKPFKVVLIHRLQNARPAPSELGVHVAPVEKVRKEVAAIIRSDFDVLRGHFVRFRMSNGKQVAIEANNETKWIAPWSAADASNTKWEWLGEGFESRDGGGILLGEMAVSNDSEEVIEVYVGTAMGY